MISKMYFTRVLFYIYNPYLSKTIQCFSLKWQKFSFKMKAQKGAQMDKKNFKFYLCQRCYVFVCYFVCLYLFVCICLTPKVVKKSEPLFVGVV